MSIRKRIKKNGKQSYQVKIKTKDQRWITKTFLKMKDAVEFENKTRSELFKNPYSSLMLKEISLNDYWEEWKENSRYKVSAGWKVSQNQMFRDYISPRIGKKTIQSISGADIQGLLNKASQIRSNQTVLHIYNLLQKLFKDAFEEYEYIPRNPVKRSHRPHTIQKESPSLTFNEIQSLLNYVKEKRYEIAIWIQIYCGLRVGEVQSLKWGDIDLERGFLTIRSTFCRKSNNIQEYPKGRKCHSVPIPNELKSLLKKHEKEDKDQFVLSENSKMMSYQSYYKMLSQYFAKLNIQGSTHTLRHSTAIIYLHFGASRDDIQELFKHSSLSVTDRYIHDEELRNTNLNTVANKIILNT